MVKGIAVLLLLLPARARAAVAWSQGAIEDTIQTTAAAVRGTDDSAVYADGHGLQRSLDGAAAGFKANLHSVQRPVAYGKRAEIGDMIRDAKERIERDPSADPDVRANIDRAASLFGASRVRFDGSMEDDDMGLYAYKKDHEHDGIIKLNKDLKTMGYNMPIYFIMATLVHEACHQGDRNLPTEDTLDGEAVAFSCQYKWLKQVDPDGEKLGQLRLALEKEQHQAPGNPILGQELKYAATLDVLVGTGGDKNRIKQFAYDLGYRDGGGLDAPPTKSS